MNRQTAQCFHTMVSWLSSRNRNSIFKKSDLAKKIGYTLNEYELHAYWAASDTFCWHSLLIFFVDILRWHSSLTYEPFWKWHRFWQLQIKRIVTGHTRHIQQWSPNKYQCMCQQLWQCRQSSCVVLDCSPTIGGWTEVPVTMDYSL